MIMKQQLVNLTRKIIPKKAVQGVEKIYRRNRLRMLSAKYHHPARDMKVLAITGTNGKTTSISVLNSIIKTSGAKTILSTTAGREVAGKLTSADTCQTVPSTENLQKLFVDAKNHEVNYVLLETTSHALAQYKIPQMDLKVAGMTNLSQDHLDYHHSMQDYADQKLKLFTDFNADFRILNRDDAWYNYFAQKLTTLGLDFVTYGTDAQADFRISKVKIFKQGSDITLKYKGEVLELSTPLAGRFNAYNIVLAASMAKLLGIANNDIVDGVANFKAVKGRLERIENDLGLDVIVDYAHTPDALEKLLEFVKSVSKGKIHIVFGATGMRDKAKRPIMGQVVAKLADRIFVTDDETHGEDASLIRKAILKGIIDVGEEQKVIEIADRGEAIEAAIEVAEPGDSILITGMGHQNQRQIGVNESIAWNDVEETQKILKAKSK